MGWWRGGGRVRVGGGQVVSFCSGWEEKWVRLVFLFLASGWGRVGVRHGDVPPDLRYSTGRGCSLKAELGEVMGGEGVRFLGVGGNGRGSRFSLDALVNIATALGCRVHF